MGYHETFIEAVKVGAVDGWDAHGILPSISIAQAILESAWGKSELAKEANNLFGIKGEYDGQSYIVETYEYVEGEWINIEAAFRKYASWNESIADHGTFFTETSWRRNNYKHVVGETDYMTAAQALSDAGYATDPSYPSKLIEIIETYHLYKYDPGEASVLMMATEVTREDNDTMIKQPKIHNKTLWSGWSGIPNPRGVIIHNDYGRMNALDYEAWLSPRNKSLGIAHYYIDRNTIARYVDTNRAAYHAGDGHGNGNRYYIGYEIIQSRGVEFGDITQAQFIENENMTLRQAAEDMQFYGLTPNLTTVQLHRNFTATSCPHLSQAIHGNGTAVQNYFIDRINYYISLGKTVKEMINAENNGVKTSIVEPARNQMVALGSTGDTYTVQAGDTLSKIANTHDVSVDNMVAWNNLPSPDKIVVGQELALSSGDPIQVVRMNVWRSVTVYKSPSFDSEVVNSKAKGSSIEVNKYAYGDNDDNGYSVWLLIDDGKKVRGYVHANNFLPYRSGEIKLDHSHKN